MAGCFDINQLLNRKPSDLVKKYLKVQTTKQSSASGLLSGQIKNSNNLRAAFGYTMIATSFVLLQWKDDVLSVISDVEFGRLPKKWPTAAESSCCCLDPNPNPNPPAAPRSSGLLFLDIVHQPHPRQSTSYLRVLTDTIAIDNPDTIITMKCPQSTLLP